LKKHCNTLQHTAIHSTSPDSVCCRVLPCVAVCCRVLQCIAVCCRVLQCVAVCCSVLQYVAVCCCAFSTPLDTVCCSMLQYVAVCCSTLSPLSIPPDAVQNCIEEYLLLCVYDSIYIICAGHTHKSA